MSGSGHAEGALSVLAEMAASRPERQRDRLAERVVRVLRFREGSTLDLVAPSAIISATRSSCAVSRSAADAQCLNSIVMRESTTGAPGRLASV